MIIKVFKQIWPFIYPYRPRVYSAVALSFLLAGISGLQVKLIKPIFDKGLSPESTLEEILFLAGSLFALGLVNFPIRFFHFYWIRSAVEKATCDVRHEVFKKIQRIPTAYFAKNKQGKLISNIILDAGYFSLGFRSLIDFFREPLKAIVYLGIAFSSDWQLTLVIFILAPFLSIIFQVTGKKMKNCTTSVQEEAAELTHNISEGIEANRLVKAFSLKGFISERFYKSQNNFLNAQMKSVFIEEIAHPLVEVVGALAFSGVIVLAYFRISSGATTVGEFVSFLAALALFMDPVRKFSQANVKISQASSAADRIQALLDIPEELDEGTHKLTNGLEESIEVDNLTFSYGEGDVIKNFSMSAKKGEKIALVGLSGSGKSTLINLLLRLYPVVKDSIKVDGKDINSIELDSLREIFGLVSQDIFLFNDSIKNNLTLGKDFSSEKLNEALHVAYAQDFVKDLPKGIDTVVGDRGTILSGGQKQRITIARAFLHDSPVLLFDEATSALDNESERIVQKALNNIASHKTVIAVAHRLSTVKDFDRIYVLKDGNLIENGNHEILMKQNGEYAKLYQLSVAQ